MRPLQLSAVGCQLLVAACVDRPEDTGVDTVIDRVPSIVSADFWCDADDGTWTLRVEADAWTGGGVTHWTEDATYVERHVVPSVSSAADGSADELLLELAVVDDWREVTPGASTSFTCASGPEVIFLLQDAAGEPVECRSWGDDPTIWSQVQGLAPCPGG